MLSDDCIIKYPISDYDRLDIFTVLMTAERHNYIFSSCMQPSKSDGGLINIFTIFKLIISNSKRSQYRVGLKGNSLFYV